MQQREAEKAVTRDSVLCLPGIETSPLSKLRQLQDERLAALIDRAYHLSGFYRRLMDAIGIRPGEIKGVEDLQHLPATKYSGEMSAQDMLAVPRDKVSVVLTTSGTTGLPKVIYLSQTDLERWKAQFARLSCVWGVGKGDVIMAGYPFPAIFDGFTAAGAMLLPFTHVSFSLDNQIRQIERLKVTAILSGPATFLSLVKRAREMGVDLKNAGMRVGILGGETWSQSFRKRMETDLGMKFYDLYGSAEVGHPASECAAQDGMHIWEDLYVVEILNPETNEPVALGKAGEIVVTPLWREAMPFIRYRTGDLAARLGYKQCVCGRTLPKISRIKGRIEHMVKVKGGNVFPGDVEEVVQAAHECSGEYQIMVDRPGSLDSLKVRVECSLDQTPSGAMRKKLEADLLKATGVASEVELVAYGGLARGGQFKGKRVVRT